ncbi:MAG TPA: hypothetical protein VNN17_01900, partial [Terriglobia bacterium]|nr:hypothetical protein [Terriglobia bacterium]
AAEKAAAARPAAAETADGDWIAAVTPVKERIQTPSKRHGDVDKSVAREFLDKIKAQLLQDEALSKYKEEASPGWVWILSGKTWGTNYTIAVRQISLLNPNTAKELLAQLQALISKRRSGWKYNYFIFLIAFESLKESEVVLKLYRSFTNREENSTARNFVNIIVLDLNQRRSVLCGKRTSDATYSAIMRALGVS